MKRIILITGLIFFWSIELFAQRIVTGYYEVRRSQKTALEVLNRGLKISRSDIYTQGLIENLYNFNPHISDWQNLEEGQQLYIELPINIVSEATLNALYSTINPKRSSKELSTAELQEQADELFNKDMKKVESKKFRRRPKRKEYEKTYVVRSDGSYELKKEIESPLSMSLDYNVDMGSYKDITASQESINTSADSFMNIGLSGAYKIDYTDTFLGSVQYSNFSELTYNNETFPMGDSYKVNFYYQTGRPGEISFHGGIDFERFHVFDGDEFETSAVARTNAFNVYYLTFGLSRLFELSSTLIFLKFNFSKTVGSTVENALVDYYGEKVLLYGAMPIFKSLSLTAFYKTQFLSGDTILEMTSYGAGFSLSFL